MTTPDLTQAASQALLGGMAVLLYALCWHATAHVPLLGRVVARLMLAAVLLVPVGYVLFGPALEKTAGVGSAPPSDAARATAEAAARAAAAQAEAARQQAELARQQAEAAARAAADQADAARREAETGRLQAEAARRNAEQQAAAAAGAAAMASAQAQLDAAARQGEKLGASQDGPGTSFDEERGARPQAKQAPPSAPTPPPVGLSPPPLPQGAGGVGSARPTGSAPSGPAGGASPGPAAPPVVARPAPAPAAPPAAAPVTTTSIDPWDVVPVFYGTDRNAESGSARVSYGADRAKRLELGRALVTVPRSHQVPEVERPWVLRLPFTQIVLYREPEDPKLHFTVKEMGALGQADFVAAVQARLGASHDYKDQALVFIHGFNNTFDNALFRTAQVAYDLKFDGASFLYSWPSKGQVGLQDYSYDRESTAQAEPYLRDFLTLITHQTGAKSVSIIAHSMGSQLLLAVLRDLKQSIPAEVAIAQIIFAAPDVDRDTFEFLAREISGVGRGITLYAASNDRALDLSRRFWGGVPRAGDVPNGGPVVIGGVDTIDVTATSTDIFALNHSGYAERPVLLSDIQKLLQTGVRPPGVRLPILKTIATPAGDYWRYPDGP